MKRLISTALTLLLLCSLTLGLTFCMGEDPAEPSMAYLLRQGKFWLTKGQGSKAYNYFYEALQKDSDNIEGLYGIVLALDSRVFSNIDGTIDILSGVYVYNPPKYECEQACARLKECHLFEQVWTTEENCMSDCPFALQPFMFETMIDGSTCYTIRDVGLEWITPTSPENCEAMCKDLDLCGLIQPPVTFDVEGCISHCPQAYVERHSKCYLQHLGQCNGFDRTCFEHVTVGLQLLFENIGIKFPPLTTKYAQKIISMPTDYEYFLITYNWTLAQPPFKIQLDGRYDHGFLYLSQALADAWEGLLLLATTVQLEMNFPSFDLHFNYGNPQGAEEIIEALIGTLETLLYDPIFPMGFQIKDEPFAVPQIKEGGRTWGRMFDSFASLIDFMLADHDRQLGKAIGYNDDNENFNWDADETATLLRGSTELTVTRPQAIALRDLSYAMGQNLLNRVPFPIGLLTELLDSFNLGDLDFLVELVAAWFPDGTIDASPLFYEPQPNSFRDFLAMLVDKLYIVLELVQELGITAAQDN